MQASKARSHALGLRPYVSLLCIWRAKWINLAFILATSESQLSGLFAFSPPTASSPVRPNSCAAPKGLYYILSNSTHSNFILILAVSVLEPSTSWSSFRLLRSKAPDVIDRMNENRSLFFDNLFKRLDKLGENSPECSTRLNGSKFTLFIGVTLGSSNLYQ